MIFPKTCNLDKIARLFFLFRVNETINELLREYVPYVDKISRGFNFADDENFQFRVDLISRLRPS